MLKLYSGINDALKDIFEGYTNRFSSGIDKNSENSLYTSPVLSIDDIGFVVSG
jgi:hypothetical protein